VTGGAGFVGRHFVRRLLDLGCNVTVVDPIVDLTGAIHPESVWPLFDPRDYVGFHFRQQDCREFFSEVPAAEYDSVFHLAAIVGGRLMIERNPIAVADDLSIDAQFWQWIRKHPETKAVCFSSSAAYPVRFQREHDYQLLVEDMVRFDADIGVPDMTYGWAKLTCEYLAQLAHERHGVDAVCYRPFSGYGEDQDDSYPFPSICRRVVAAEHSRRVTVWGSGRQMRDFIHIDDCVEGVLSTMGKVDDGSAVNLSTGTFTSFIEFARLAAAIYGYDATVEGTSDKPEGVFARAGDVALQRELGFSHRVGFDEGIRRALGYYAGRHTPA
jgi:nucleoside-diphosphate-sugar epimerase